MDANADSERRQELGCCTVGTAQNAKKGTGKSKPLKSITLEYTLGLGNTEGR